MCHYLSSMKEIRKLTISFNYFDEDWLNSFGEVLRFISSTLEILEVHNNGQVDCSIRSINSYTSLSSSDFEKITQNTEELEVKFDELVRGLSDCTKLQ